MLFGRSVIHWIIVLFIAVCVFIPPRAIPLLFGLVGFQIPDQIATILALLIALGCVWRLPWRGTAASRLRHGVWRGRADHHRADHHHPAQDPRIV